jgi:hypothetical protein
MYRNILAVFTVAVVLISANTTLCQETYQKGPFQIIRSNPNVPLLSSLNVKEMGTRYLSDFSYSRALDIRYGFRLYNFGSIDIHVGLLPGVREAETAILDGLYDSNMYWEEWPAEWNKVGDSAWYKRTYISKDGDSYIGGVAFIRKNAIIWLTMGPNEGVDFREIAEVIDRDILTGADYLKVEDKIAPPVVTGVSLTKRTLREGEWTDITFQASDPSGSSLKYFASGVYDEKTNSWRYSANRASLLPGVPFEGPHTVTCWVVNENNLFSRITEETVTF